MEVESAGEDLNAGSVYDGRRRRGHAGAEVPPPSPRAIAVGALDEFTAHASYEHLDPAPVRRNGSRGRREISTEVVPAAPATVLEHAMHKFAAAAAHQHVQSARPRRRDRWRRGDIAPQVLPATPRDAVPAPLHEFIVLAADEYLQPAVSGCDHSRAGNVGLEALISRRGLPSERNRERDHGEDIDRQTGYRRQSTSPLCPTISRRRGVPVSERAKESPPEVRTNLAKAANTSSGYL